MPANPPPAMPTGPSSVALRLEASPPAPHMLQGPARPAPPEHMTGEKLSDAIGRLLGLHELPSEDFRATAGGAAMPMIDHLQALATKPSGSMPASVIEAMLHAQGRVDVLLSRLHELVQGPAPVLSQRHRSLLDDDDAESMPPPAASSNAPATADRRLLSDAVRWQALDVLRTAPPLSPASLSSPAIRAEVAGRLEDLHSLAPIHIDPRVLRAAIQAHGDPAQLLEALANISPPLARAADPGEAPPTAKR